VKQRFYEWGYEQLRKNDINEQEEQCDDKSNHAWMQW
jgi:hypothetical protein